MRVRERGMGNLPFIAVLVLFIIAVAMFFVSRSERDDFEQKVKTQAAQITAKDEQLRGARDAYDAMHELWGLNIPELKRNVDAYPKSSVIQEKLQSWMSQVVEEVAKRSEAKVKNRQYQINKDEKTVKVIEGDPTVIRLYGQPSAKVELTVKKLMDGLPSQFAFAAKAIEENNSKFETEYTTFQQKLTELRNTNSSMQGKYDQDIAARQASIDTLTSEKNELQDQVNNQTATNDTLQSGMSKVKAEAEKKARGQDRAIRALQDRLANERNKKALALAEDPKDGEVLVADVRTGLVQINLGRRNKVSNGTKFFVWRAGKGDMRQNVAVVQVIRVQSTGARARIIKLLNPRVPVTAGMNISNPVYDPYKPLKIYIYGELRRYPTEVAKRRLAASGAVISPRLDDTVDVIVLGEPPVAAAGEESEDEAGAALAQRRAVIERDKRLREVMDKAIAIGAVVVTEKVLGTFIDY